MLTKQIIKTMVIDDSFVFRKFLIDNLPKIQERIEIVGYATDPLDAMNKIPRLKPDVITLDVEMPHMTGIEFLKELLPKYPIPVILVSSLNVGVFDALSYGAVDFVRKPDMSVENATMIFAQNLATKILIAKQAKVRLPASMGPAAAKAAKNVPTGSAPVGKNGGGGVGTSVNLRSNTAPGTASASGAGAKAAPSRSAVPTPISKRPVQTSAVSGLSMGRTPAKGINPATREKSIAPPINTSIIKLTSTAALRLNATIIAIGASTGGTEATLEVMRQLPANIPGMVITQHMPQGFTQMYAERLNRICQMKVKEAEDGDTIQRGLALIAPGGDLQMKVVRSGSNYKVRCIPGEKVNGHRPSVDVLFQSMAETVKGSGIGIILTGMGQDGAHGLLAMRNAGAYTIGQDQESSVVYGMPKVAHDIGGVCAQASCSSIPNVLMSHLNKF